MARYKRPFQDGCQRKLGSEFISTRTEPATLFLSQTACLVVRDFHRRSHLGLAILFARLIQTIIAVVGFLISLSVVAPSFQVSDLVKLLGVGTVAIGFAFQNILQNFLAGILLLLEEPFRLGDLISVTGIEGNVRDVQTRATVITTKEGRKVVIPNAVLQT